MPEFPKVPYDRKAPRILTADAQTKVIAAITFERRGLFLAMAHTLRPGEARAADLFHWEAPDLLVQQAVKGPKADSVIRGLKERDWRVVGASDELEAWIVDRIKRASPEERLRRRGVPLFPLPKTGARWSDNSLRREWARACKRAGVGYVPPYSGTKHTTATNLIRSGVNPAMLQRFLGHADRRSTDAYVVLAQAEVKDLVRGKPR